MLWEMFEVFIRRNHGFILVSGVGCRFVRDKKMEISPRSFSTPFRTLQGHGQGEYWIPGCGLPYWGCYINWVEDSTSSQLGSGLGLHQLGRNTMATRTTDF